MARFALSVLVLALGLSLAATSVYAGGKGNKDGHAKKEARLEKRSARLGERIGKVQQRLAAHPNAPAAVKAAADKLLGSLKTAQDDANKALAAVQARDKQQVKSLKATLKSDRQAIRADRKAFREAITAAIKDLRGMKGHGGKHKGAAK